MVLRLICLIVLVAGAVTWAVTVRGTGEVAFAEKLDHPGGLRAELPAGYRAEQRLEGYRFSPPENTRLVRWIEITETVTPPHVVPSGETVVERSSHHILEAIGGGSGGTEYQLIAWKAAGDRFITVNAIEQTEWGTPDFAIAWAVLKRSRFEATKP